MVSKIITNKVLFPAALFAILLFMSACIETQQPFEQQAFALWRDLNITYLKQPKMLMLTNKEKEQTLAKLSTIKTKLEASKPFPELSYSNISLLFTDFLKEKLALFESKDAYFLFKVLPEKDLQKASEQDCNKLLSFSSFASKLEALLVKARTLNSLAERFSQSYAEQARQSNVMLLRVDEKAIEDAKRKAELAIFSGKLCSLNLKAKKFFESIAIADIDCNSLASLQSKISEAKALSAEAEKLFEEALTYNLNAESLAQSYANMQDSLSELERLYVDLNSSC